MKELNINIPVTMKQEDELTEQEKASENTQAVTQHQSR